MTKYVVEVGCVNAGDDMETSGTWFVDDCEVEAGNPEDAAKLGLAEIRARYDTKGHDVIFVWPYSVYKLYEDELEDHIETYPTALVNEFVVGEREE